MPTHLEQLLSEWLEFKGYFVRHNVKVGKLPHGGYEGEVDIVAYHPKNKHLIHIESSLAADSWEKREVNFKRKFDIGRKYIISEIFSFLPSNTRIEQWAVVDRRSNKTRKTVGGGKVVPIGQLYRDIAKDIRGLPKGRAIPEHFPLLRAMQLTLNWVCKEMR